MRLVCRACQTSTSRRRPQAAATRRVLGHVLDQLLKLLHPVIPFVTDELWCALTGEQTVVRAAWPTVDPAYVDDGAEAELASLQRVVTEVRRFRSDQGLRPGQRVAPGWWASRGPAWPCTRG